MQPMPREAQVIVERIVALVHPLRIVGLP